MPNDFYLMILEIPEVITLEYIKSTIEKASGIDIKTAKVLSEFVQYDIEDIDISEELEEEDLFNISSDDLKIKYAARQHLVDSINYVLSPRIGIDSRANLDISHNNMKYISIGSKTYAVTGYEKSYSSKNPSMAYSYLVALNVSSII